MNADLRAFWDRTHQELRQVDPNPQLALAPEHTGREYTTESVILTSFGGQRLRGWYSVPVDRPRGGRLPVSTCTRSRG